MFRTVVAVITGLAVFAACAVVFFLVSRHGPEAVPTAIFAAITVIVGLASAVFAGWVTGRVAPGTPVTHCVLLAVLIAFTGLTSFFLSPGIHWTQMLVMFVFAPATLGGGMIVQEPRSR